MFGRRFTSAKREITVKARSGIKMRVDSFAGGEPALSSLSPRGEGGGVRCQAISLGPSMILDAN